MCSHCAYHTSAEWELDSALADVDDDTRQAYWAVQHQYPVARRSDTEEAVAE